MGMMTIHEITHRTVDEETLRRLHTYLYQPSVRDDLERTGWWEVSKKAIAYLRDNPIAVEYVGDRRYMVEIPSKSEPGEVWHASRHECECTGNRRHQHCYHRVIAMFFPIIDRIEAELEEERRERARSVITPYDDGEGGVEYELTYDGVFLGYATSIESAEERLGQYRQAIARRAQRMVSCS